MSGIVSKPYDSLHPIIIECGCGYQAWRVSAYRKHLRKRHRKEERRP